jgi:tetratricopeptide (TPR) repeat protein
MSLNQHFQRGSLLYHQGRYAEAIGELHLQLAAGEDSLTHGLLALCFAQVQKFAEATEHAQQAIQLAPDEAFGHYALAQVLLLRNRFDEARAAILEAIRLSPYDADYFAILGSIHLRTERWREALEAANQGLQIEPEHGVLTNLRAQALVKLGDRAGAAATIGEALARRPDDPYTHANQGWTLLHQGQPYKAMEHFREALRLNPQLEWARLGIVESLKARNILYRLMLGYFLWMARLPSRVRLGLVGGAFVANMIVGEMASRSPRLAPILIPLLYAYFGFVLLSWLSYPLFNLLLRLDRFGRHALSPDQLRGANVLAVCLLVLLLAAGRSIAAHVGWPRVVDPGQVKLIDYCTQLCALLALPASAIYICDPGWPRQVMALITAALAGAVAIVAILVSFPLQQLSPFIVLPLGLLLLVLPFAMLLSQIAANYLMTATPRK